jgi:hypothetical protein
MLNEETKQYRWNLRLLKFNLPRLHKIIPDNIKKKLPEEELMQFLDFTDKLLKEVHEAQRELYTCNKCHKHKKKPIKDKKIYYCDFCGKMKDTLYKVKD